MAELELRDVWKLYGDVRAVRGVSFRCEDKTLVAILGPSGAGKTSILKMIAGVEPVTKGDILVDGHRVNDVEPDEREVAMVFETYALYPNLSVFENIAFPLRAPRRAKQYDEKTVRDKVERVAALLGLGELLQRRPAELSGGQRQRVALGRALVRTPKVLLLDEPIAHLDAKLRNRMRGEIRHLARTLDCTIVYVTHDYREALAIADKVIVLNKGQIQQVGTPEELFWNPKTDFVADLIGDPPMNLIDCTLTCCGEERFAAFEGFRVKLGPEAEGRLRELGADGDRLRLGVRPIDVKIAPLDRSAPDALCGEVYVVEPVGAHNIVTLKMGAATLVQAVVGSSFVPKMGDQYQVSFARIHLFRPTVQLENHLAG